jgi:hypothetical protein
MKQFTDMLLENIDAMEPKPSEDMADVVKNGLVILEVTLEEVTNSMKLSSILVNKNLRDTVRIKCKS